MANQSVTWSINSRNEVSLIYEGHQGPPISGEDRVIDISHSVSGMVFILLNHDGVPFLEYSDSIEHPQWAEVAVILPAGLHVHKIDAGPKNNTYLVLSDGTVGVISKPKEGQKSATPEILEGTEDTLEVSAGPDALVWVIAYDSSKGTVVRWFDPKGETWHTIDGIEHPRRITGIAKGKAYIIDVNGKIILIDKKGNTEVVSEEFAGDTKASQISASEDGTLWLVVHGSLNSELVYISKDKGKNWTKIENAEAHHLDAGVLKNA